MDRKDQAKIAALIPLLVFGTTLNTLGIVLTGLGWVRYAMMGAGVLMLLVFVVLVIQARPGAGDPPENPSP